MKRVNLFIVMLVLLTSLVACGASSDNKPNQDVSDVTTKGSSAEAESEAESEMIVELSPEQQVEADLGKIVNENYRSTTIDKVTLNSNLGTDDDSDYVALIYLTWDVANKPDTTKQMIAMYSEDFAARIGQDILSISDVAFFWTIPYYSETETAAKYSYERQDAGMYQTDAIWTGVVK